MDQFFTLMRREWMQHRIGWLVVMAAPSLLFLLAGLIDGRVMHVTIGGDESSTVPALQSLPIALQTLGWTVATAMVTLVVACLTALVQLPGMARRDVQDRSIEFWRSLPTSDVRSVGATVLMHLLVMPALAVTAGLAGAQLVALLAITTQQGPMAWLTQPWGTVLPAIAVVALRLLLGLTLAVAWLSPLLMLTMAASAWLKRWALPALVVGLIFGVQWVDRQLAQPLFKPTLERLGSEARGALLPLQVFQGLDFDGPQEAAAALPDLPGLLLRDAAHALGNAASPAFVAALLVAAGCFWLMVLRRRRGG